MTNTQWLMVVLVISLDLNSILCVLYNRLDCQPDILIYIGIDKDVVTNCTNQFAIMLSDYLKVGLQHM